MSNQIHIIQNAITTTISEIFRGDFRRICEVKKAVLHLEAIYFCHGTCYLLKRENMPIKDQLALYQRIELIPQSTTEFFENNRECIINNWPEEAHLQQNQKSCMMHFWQASFAYSLRELDIKSIKLAEILRGHIILLLTFLRKLLIVR